MAVRETMGRSAMVRVLDTDGFPLPNVQILLELPWGEPHVQLIDGVQDLDHWTDLSGRCRFIDLPADAVEVTAKHGSRQVIGKLERDSLQLVMPAE
jgi:hypothetical protein